mmetsp:Transcript_33249/g.80437  ORF Transcript_33249/g.80437 Transcript_33249/m.80437 type:complete len:282 (-) Transcript_33249:532-1377(-)
MVKERKITLSRPSDLGVVVDGVVVDVRHIRAVREKQHGRIWMSEHVVDYDLLVDHAPLLVSHNVALRTDRLAVHVRRRRVCDQHQRRGSDQPSLGDETRGDRPLSSMGDARLFRNDVVHTLAMIPKILHGSDRILLLDDLYVAMDRSYGILVVVRQRLSFARWVGKRLDHIPQIALGIVIQGHFILDEVLYLVASHEEPPILFQELLSLLVASRDGHQCEWARARQEPIRSVIHEQLRSGLDVPGGRARAVEPRRARSRSRGRVPIETGVVVVRRVFVNVE